MTTALIVGAFLVLYFAYKVYSNKGIRQINVSTAKQMIKDSKVELLDVRTPQEFTGGHIKGARNIPVSELASRLGELNTIKDKTIIVYCHAGSRSAAASQVLHKNGFTKVHNLVGGYSSWGR